MKAWQKVWREGVAPLLSTEGLQALANALEEADPRLVQGATTVPPPLQCTQDWPIEAGCALAYIGAVENGGFGVEADGKTRREGGCTVAVAEEFFARMCFEIDQRLGEPAGCRWWLNWHDETPYPEMSHDLLEEIELVLMER